MEGVYAREEAEYKLPPGMGVILGCGQVGLWNHVDVAFDFGLTNCDGEWSVNQKQSLLCRVGTASADMVQKLNGDDKSAIRC